MAESSLIHGSARTPVVPGYNAARNIRSFFGTRDPFQSAALKALVGHAGPRKKHLATVIDAVQKDHMKMEDYVVTCHALSQWASKHATCCKCLTSLLVVLHLGPPVASPCVEPISQYLSTIRDTWGNEDMFLSQFAVAVLSRLTFLADHPEFSNHFNLNATSTNGLSLPHIEPTAHVSILSQMLAMLSRLNTVIQGGLKNYKDGNFFRSKEREAVKYALFTLYEDAFCAHVASSTLLQRVAQPTESERSAADLPAAGMIGVFRELYDEQFAALRTAYVQLQGLSDSGGGYSVMGLELSRCPDGNPLANAAAVTGAGTAGSRVTSVLDIDGSGPTAGLHR